MKVLEKLRGFVFAGESTREIERITQIEHNNITGFNTDSLIPWVKEERLNKLGGLQS